jgi:hypothetical protein
VEGEALCPEMPAYAQLGAADQGDERGRLRVDIGAAG